MTIARVNNIEIWYETFGNRADKAVLLVMGACCQSILWPTEFCEMLASKGFYVIRYDHRDTGQSSHFAFEKNPYSIEDMAQDAIELLNFLDIKKFILAGLSLGGPIAEIISVKEMQRTNHMLLIATSCDFRPMNLAYAGLAPESNQLPSTKDIYLQWIKRFTSCPPKTEEEYIQFGVEGWKILSGNHVPFEHDLYIKLNKECMNRARHPTSHVNHLQVCRSAEEIIRTIPLRVTVPTVIIHGSEDPIFPEDHGKALARKIKHAKYILAEGFGHVPNRHFYELMIDQITQKNKLASETN